MPQQGHGPREYPALLDIPCLCPGDAATIGGPRPGAQVRPIWCRQGAPHSEGCNIVAPSYRLCTDGPGWNGRLWAGPNRGVWALPPRTVVCAPFFILFFLFSSIVIFCLIFFPFLDVLFSRQCTFFKPSLGHHCTTCMSKNFHRHAGHAGSHLALAFTEFGFASCNSFRTFGDLS